MELRGGGFRWFPLVSVGFRWVAERLEMKNPKQNILLLHMEPSKTRIRPGFGPKVTQSDPKMTQSAPKWPQNDPKWPQNAPKVTPKRSQSDSHATQMRMQLLMQVHMRLEIQLQMQYKHCGSFRLGSQAMELLFD